MDANSSMKFIASGNSIWTGEIDPGQPFKTHCSCTRLKDPCKIKITPSKDYL
jgi:hypothetical protein